MTTIEKEYCEINEIMTEPIKKKRTKRAEKRIELTEKESQEIKREKGIQSMPSKDIWDENKYLWAINDLHCDRNKELREENIRLQCLLEKNGVDYGQNIN